MANMAKVGSLKDLIEFGKVDIINYNTTGVMNSATSGNCQIYINAGKYYCESSCCMRGAVPDVNNGITVYDISTFVHNNTIESIKASFFNIVREKIKDDCSAFVGMVEQMKKDNYLPKTVLCDHNELFDEFFEVGKKVSVL